MKKSSTLHFIISALALGLATPMVHAYEAGDVLVRTGWIRASPKDNSRALKLDGKKVKGSSVSVDHDNGLGLTIAYMFTEHFGAELLAATPFDFNIKARGMPTLYNKDGSKTKLDGKFAKVSMLPPTLTAQYYPMDKNSAFQPYVGVGVNYTFFYDRHLKSQRRDEGFSRMHLTDSWGAAGQVGMDYLVMDNVLLNAAVWKIQMKTKARIDGPSALGVQKTKVSVPLNPWVYMLGVGYKF